MRRSTFLMLAGAWVGAGPSVLAAAFFHSPAAHMTLLKVPIELGGDWSGSAPTDAFVVVSRMRDACLSGVALWSDRQPGRLRVDDQSSGPPHVWLHTENPGTGWVVVDFAPRHWIQLAYQFGHELGHVLCNSWVPQATLKPPSRWLEESMVEAFSIRGLGLLAASWEQDPPFPHDGDYAAAIRKYRDNLIEKYRPGNEARPVTDLVSWFRSNRPALDRATGLGALEGPAIVAILGEFEQNQRAIADMGAVNRWPGFSALPIEEYLRTWERSCREIGAPGILPSRIRGMFDIA